MGPGPWCGNMGEGTYCTFGDFIFFELSSANLIKMASLQPSGVVPLSERMAASASARVLITKLFSYAQL